MGPTDALPRGCGVEALGPPKHRPFTWYHLHPSPTYLRMDARWQPDRIHWESSRRKPTRTRTGSFPVLSWFACLSPSPCKLRNITNGLRYLHSQNVVHGDLKGVRSQYKSRFTIELTLRLAKHPCQCQWPGTNHRLWLRGSRRRSKSTHKPCR